jgi:uncharacterized protein YbjT (DUF2867 family)
MRALVTGATGFVGGKLALALGESDFAERNRAAASNFARMASAEGIGRVCYLGGLRD